MSTTDTKPKKTTHSKNLIFTEKFDSFSEFYDRHKIDIYKSIVDVFVDFKDKRKKKVELNIEATIEIIEWKHKMTYYRKDFDVLIEDLIPYFESVEEYEICKDIKMLHAELTK